MNLRSYGLYSCALVHKTVGSHLSFYDSVSAHKSPFYCYDSPLMLHFVKSAQWTTTQQLMRLSEDLRPRRTTWAESSIWKSDKSIRAQNGYQLFHFKDIVFQTSGMFNTEYVVCEYEYVEYVNIGCSCI